MQNDSPDIRGFFNAVAAAGAAGDRDRLQMRIENIFYQAVLSGNVPLVSRMIDACPDSVRWHEEGWRDRDYAFEQQTALHRAAGRGDVAMARLLVGRGAKVDAWDAGHCTPLMYAAAKGHRDMVVYLLGQGADPARRGYLGYVDRPLGLAESQGHSGVADILRMAQAVTPPSPRLKP